MRNPSGLLENERRLEKSFVADEIALGRTPNGWTAALVMFHVAQWRERLRSGLVDFQAGRPYTRPPANIDEFNDVELASGQGISLEESSARADAALGELVDLCAAVGDRPFKWNLTSTTGDALVRNSYFHPRVHITAYLQENGEDVRAHALVEDTASELRKAWPSPLILGAGLYNLAGVRVAQGRWADALDLLEEAAPMRPDLCANAARDDDLAPLRDEARFQALITPA